MAKVKPGWEDKNFWGYAGKTLIKGKRLGDLSSDELSSIIDNDPGAARMIEREKPQAVTRELPTSETAQPPKGKA